MQRFFKLLFKINPITFYFNLKYFPISVAIKMPVLIIGKVSIHALKGKVIINAPTNCGMIRIGDLRVGIFDKKMRTIFNINGTMVFNGQAKIGRGSSISIGKDSVLNIGRNLNITAKTSIIASDKRNIWIGENCLISWDVLIMNTDFHNILDKHNNIKINESADINISNNVWIGCCSTILKGTNIAEYSVIASNSVVVGELKSPYTIYGGVVAKKIKDNISWEM